MRESSEAVSPLELVETSEEQNTSRKSMSFTGTRLTVTVILTHVMYVIHMQEALTLLSVCEAHTLCGVFFYHQTAPGGRLFTAGLSSTLVLVDSYKMVKINRSLPLAQ